jgi:hypothetical protein
MNAARMAKAIAVAEVRIHSTSRESMLNHPF